MKNKIVWPAILFAFVFGCGRNDQKKNHVPVADAGGPYFGAEGFLLEFDGSKSADSDGDALTYLWNFGDGATGEGVKPTHIYENDGEFAVCLAVSDGEAVSSSSCTTAAILDTDFNFPPFAQAGEDQTVDLGAEAIFDGSNSFDLDGEIVSYAWDFGDGATGEGVIAAHVYQEFGAYTAALTVTDDQGAATTDVLTATVVDEDAELAITKIVAKDTEPAEHYHVKVEVANTGTVPVTDALFHAEVHDSCLGHHLDWGLEDRYVSFEVGEEKSVVWSGKVPEETEPGDYFAEISIFFSGKVVSSSGSFVVE